MKLNTQTLKDVEIGIPVVVEGTYHARFDKVEIKPNKSGDGNNLYVMLKILDNPVVSHKDGKEIENRGQVVCSRYISLKPTEKYNPNTMLKELAIAIGHPEDQDLSDSDLPGKVVMVKLSVRAEDRDPRTGQVYPVSNDIGRFTPVPESDTFSPSPLL